MDRVYNAKMLPFVTAILTILLLQQTAAFTFEEVNPAVNVTSLDPLLIFMDEGNKPPTSIIRIVDAVSQPTLQFIGQNLSLAVVSDGGNWLIQVMDPVDYDANPSAMAQGFTINVIDTASNQVISLKINNIHDNNPILVPSPCTLTENTTITFDNACEFEIQDPDGWLASLDFSNIRNSANGGNESDIFVFRYRDIPVDTVYAWPVFLMLQDGLVLDYEKVTMYVFYETVTDAVENTSPETQIIVQVEDIPDTPPIWTSFTATQQVVEKTETTISIVARDGNFGVNDAINYTLSNIDRDDVPLTIDETSGTISVPEIDRDRPVECPHDQVSFDVTASCVNSPEWSITDRITLMVSDIDDNLPLIYMGNDMVSPQTYNISIPENYNDALDEALTIYDIDFGDNALYDVVAQKGDATDTDYSIAFQMIPNKGYQEGAFQITVKDVQYLDFERPGWKDIYFQVFASETKNVTMQYIFPIEVHLIDYNDETPQFALLEYFSTVLENITTGTNLPEATSTDELFIQATDLDQEDIDKGVKHTLLGAMANSMLKIEDLGGHIFPIKDRAFDYEKNAEIVIQIQAEDNADPAHRNTTQLTITVLDVNDVDPVLATNPIPEVEENQADGYVIAGVEISASDVDTDAILVFRINWEGSYATKNSRRLEPVEFQNYSILHSLKVNTKPVGEGNDFRSVSAQLIIVETRKDNTPDFEVFDSLFIALEVHDLNTIEGKGYDSAIVLISIKNINDNPPEFTQEAKNANRSISEKSDLGTPLIGVTANDIDNLEPLFYTLESRQVPNVPDTPDDWIVVDSATGSLTVGGDITCDAPDYREYLYYTATVNDTLFIKDLDLQIYITDVNNQPPSCDNCGQELFIEEDYGNHPDVTKDGEIIRTFVLHDNDRDEPYRTVSCRLGAVDVSVNNRFRVENDKEFTVSLQVPATLNREDIETFRVVLNCVDNPTREGSSLQNTVPYEFTLTLLDVNDNVPIVDVNVPQFRFLENDGKDTLTPFTIQGIDPDKEENGTIDFTLERIERFLDQSHTISKDGDTTDLFIIDSTDITAKTATIKPSKDLRDFYGFYILTIKTKDHGAEPLEKDDNQIFVEVAKYNFEEISFIYPEDQKTYYLYPEQTLDNSLLLWNGDDRFGKLNATDNQGDKYDITFSITDDNDELPFVIRNNEILIRSALDPNEHYQLLITADINAEQNSNDKPHTKDVTIFFRTFDSNMDPIFDVNQQDAALDEDHLLLTVDIPEARYPIDDDDEEFKNLEIYYLLINNFANTFAIQLNDSKPQVVVTGTIDYNNGDKEYNLTVVASNTNSLKPNIPDDSELNLIITINCVNNHPPTFNDQKFFGTVVTGSEKPGNAILTIVGTDPDPCDEGLLVYSIENVNIDNIQGQLPSDLFNITLTTGIITISFQVEETMSGYFVLDVKIVDPDPTEHFDTTTATIYIVRKENTVFFRFENDVNAVLDRTSDISSILNDQFGLTSTVESATVDPASSDDNPITIVPCYFINDTLKEPLLATDVLKRLTNLRVYTELKNNLLGQSLLLLSFDTQNPQENVEEVLKAWLIGVAVVLGALVVILLIAFVLKTRSLSQRIKNLSSTKFGSQESGMNRAGVAAPTTNKHAIEGSNPVYNTKEIENNDGDDTGSVASGDSALYGVEDNPEFTHDDYPTKNGIIL